MAHNLFGEAFVQRGTAPAWHKLGHTYALEDEVTATDAFNHHPYIISLQPLTTSVVNPLSGAETQLEIAQRAIVRWPTPDDPTYKNFGVVGPEYHLLDPETVCRIWDEAVGRSISTYGVMAGGSEMFISIQMPGFQIEGDDHENYLIFHSPWNGLHAYKVFQAPKRVVCNNTYKMAEELAGEMLRISHTKNAETYLKRWMSGIYERAEAKTHGMKAVLERFAAIKLTAEDVDSLIDLAFPLPPKPRVVPDREVMAKRSKAWDVANEQNNRYRAQVKVLYEGMGWGMESKACAGTLFGWYNAAVEGQDHGPTKRPMTAAYDMLFGVRADRKLDAFNAAYNFAGV